MRELVDNSLPLRWAGLADLSDLHRAEKKELAAVWSSIPMARRRQVVERLIDLAEDNPELVYDDVFIVALFDGDASVRVLALRGLWEYEGVDILPTLTELAENDEDIAVRAEAAMSLGRFALLAELSRLPAGDGARLERTLRAIINSGQESVEVRARAIEAAGVLNRPWVVQMIQQAYQDGSYRLRTSAVHAMGRNGDPCWLSTVIRELASDDPEMRYEAATAAGGLAVDAAVPPLAVLLTDDDAEVRAAAIAALGQIGGKEAKQHLRAHLDDAEPWVREAITQALAETDFFDDPLGFTL